MSLAQLDCFYRYPEQKPDVPPCNHGWLQKGTAEALQAHLNERTRVVIELGSWMGLSTRFIANAAPNATVIAVDHWCGSAEHHLNPAWRAMLPYLYETFLVSCWEYRERIIPMRMASTAGLMQIAMYGVAPDLIFIDAAHDEKSVREDVEAARRLFPYATLVGDDWQILSVQNGVLDVLRGGSFGHNEAAWWFTPKQMKP